MVRLIARSLSNLNLSFDLEKEEHSDRANRCPSTPCESKHNNFHLTQLQTVNHQRNILGERGARPPQGIQYKSRQFRSIKNRQQYGDFIHRKSHPPHPCLIPMNTRK